MIKKIKSYKINTIYRELTLPARAGIWFLICSILQKGISAVTTPIYTRLMSTAEYGNVSTYYAWADLLSVVITFGLSSTVYSRGIVKSNGKEKEYTTIMVTLCSGLSLLSYLFCFFFCLLFKKYLNLSFILINSIYVYVFFNTIIEFWFQEKRVFYRYKAFVFLTLFLSFIKPPVSILSIIYFNQFRVEARILSETVVVLLVGLVLFIPMICNNNKHYDRSIWKESIVYIIPLIPHYISQRVLSQSDRIMIQQLTNSSDAGIYSLAYSLGMLLTILYTSINNTLGPWTFRKIQSGESNIVGRLGEQLLIFFALCVVSFSLIAPELVKLFAPRAYYEAIYLVPVIAYSAYFIFMYGLFINFEYFSGKTQYIMIATVLSAIVNLLLNKISIPIFGYKAAAYTTLICYCLYAIGHYFIMSKICKEEYEVTGVFNGKRVVVITLILGVLVTICLFVYSKNVIRLFMVAIFTIFTIVDAIFVVNRYGKNR